MKPIFFPFTYISKTVTVALNTCFPEITVYQPSEKRVPAGMGQLAETGMLDIRVPVQGDEDELDALYIEYKNWAHTHKGVEISFFMDRKDTIPFYDDNTPQKLRGDILKYQQNDQGKQDDHGKEVDNSLLIARLFLVLTQDYDIQNEDLEHELKSHEGREKSLFKALLGEDDNVVFNENKEKQKEPFEDQGAYMTGERIKFWSRLMIHDDNDSGIYITNSRAVFDHVIDTLPDAEEICRFEAIPRVDSDDNNAWQSDLKAYIDEAVSSSQPASIEKPVYDQTAGDSSSDLSLSLYVVQGVQPKNLVSRIGGVSSPEGGGKGNTIIGLLS